METKRRRPKEVFRVRLAVLSVAVFVALLLEATLPPTLPLARLFQFPLLVTVYFSMIRQNQTFGIVFGTVVGLLQDALSHAYLGQMGMAKAVVGYLAATAGLKFEFDNLLVRGLLLGSLVFIHNGFNYLLTHELLGLPPPFEPLYLASSVLVNVALGLILFPVFDRLRQSA
jgi:rod shape-determining protein MreD